MQFRPRRSVLYMPGANARAMEKARGLSCDAIIFDLEDAVAVDAKAIARNQVAKAVADGGYGHRELIVRVNGLDTEWGHDDLAAVVDLPVDALLFPKVETTEQVASIIAAVDAVGGTSLPVWLMIETPAGVLDARSLAGASPRVGCLVMGTSDLVKELRARHTASRSNLSFALQSCVLAARSAGVDVLDGVHLDFRNAEAFRDACQQGRDMGFDGKTLIHPTQIETANEVFGYGEAAIEHARAVIAAWEAAQREGKGVAVLNGALVENLHVAEAERVLAFAAALTDR